ncbi:unnamed protein product [Musa hybrid cultivar]
MSTQKKRNFNIEAFKRRVNLAPRRPGRCSRMPSTRFTHTIPAVSALKNSPGMLIIWCFTNMEKNCTLDL